jgi:hypothetical protein
MSRGSFALSLASSNACMKRLQSETLSRALQPWGEKQSVMAKHRHVDNGDKTIRKRAKKCIKDRGSKKPSRPAYPRINQSLDCLI